MSRRPTDIGTARMAPWRGCRRFLRSKASAPSSPAARSGHVESRIAVCGRRPGRCFRRQRSARTCFALAAAPPRGASSCMSGSWRTDDFAGAAIAVADCANDDDAAQVCSASRAAGVPVNVIDRPALLRFFLRRDRQPFAAGHRHFDRRRVAGIRPGDPRQDRGADPERFCALGRCGAHAGGRACRRSLCHSAAGARSGRNSPSARCPHRTLRRPMPISMRCSNRRPRRRMPARSFSVGAGPGDPELLTLRAVRALQSADVILFDDLVAPDILDFARREAKKMLVGKTGHRAVLQAGRHQRADDLARQSRPPRGAAQGRRPDDFRPRR